MYYALIILSVVMFSGCFAFKDIYRKLRGSGIKAAIEFSLFSSAAALLVLIIVNKFRLEFTVFTLLMAMLSTVNSFAFTFCSFKSLDYINLSVYSLFSMLGGMALPFVQGIVFYGEDMTVAKLVCFIFVILALLLTIKKGEKKNGTIYYVGIFILNGMSGVISKIFASSPYPKTSAAGYSILSTICTIVVSILLLLFLKKQKVPKLTLKSFSSCAASGIINRIANYFLVISLMHIDASAQYPMVTGGVMITSTLICFFNSNKPTKKEILQVILAFIGMLALFIIPI